MNKYARIVLLRVLERHNEVGVMMIFLLPVACDNHSRKVYATKELTLNVIATLTPLLIFASLFPHDMLPAFQAVRCQVLDYFFRQRECLRDDHVLFSFERSMLFSKAEFDLINQVISVGFLLWVLCRRASVVVMIVTVIIARHFLSCCFFGRDGVDTIVG